MSSEEPSERTERRRRLPGSIWALGAVSLFMDASSEMVHAVLPVFLVGTLGAGAFTVGLIEGTGEAVAAFAKLFAGRISDRMGKRKLFALVGYGMAALSKPLFAMAGGVGMVLGARLVDRTGKGVRGAPRDALIADLVPATLRGAAYGLRQALDSAGAVLGPLLALGVLALVSEDLRTVFWIACLPAVLSVAILAMGVRDPAGLRPSPSLGLRLRRADLGALGGRFWRTVTVAACLTLARFSEAFLVLRAEELGLAFALLPLVFVLLNLVYAAAAYPAGALSDRFGRAPLVAIGFLALLAADLLAGFAEGLAPLAAGIILWGVHLALTQGQLAALVADGAPAHLRGTAFGVFHLVSGLTLLAASALAGWLWQSAGAAAAFLAGAGLCALGLLAGLLLLRTPPDPQIT